MRSAIMGESSGLQFFRVSIGIQWGPVALEESRIDMTFPTFLTIAVILRPFTLVLEVITDCNNK